jgi:hypothetical protein
VTSAQDQRPVREGDVIYFHDLHLETARRVSDTPVYQDRYAWEVEGKPRPMIVLYAIVHAEDKTKSQWFRVLKLSTKISPFKRRLGFKEIGKILGNKQSYCEMTPYWFPAKLVDGRVKCHLDRLKLNSIYAEIGGKGRPSPEE